MARIPFSSSIGLVSLVAVVAVFGCGSPSADKPNLTPTAVNAPPAQKEAVKKGPGRVPVEHGLDADVVKIDATPKVISVEQLLATRDEDPAIQKVDLAGYHEKRVAPFETTTFEVSGKITKINHEKDGDYYFVLEGKTGAQAVIEVPDPALCAGSPLLPKIKATRDMLTEHFHPTDTPKEVNEEITVDGVGFLGSRRKKGSGSFGDSVRLMPGVGVKFDSESVKKG